MHHILLFSGSALLIFSFIWAYLWLEVFRDPTGELQCFYVHNPVAYKAIGTSENLSLLLSFSENDSKTQKTAKKDRF